MNYIMPEPPPPDCPQCEEGPMKPGIFTVKGTGEVILNAWLCRGCQMVWEEGKDVQA